MLVIALPMVVSQACDTVMIFTDRLFLSKLSPELMNAAMGGGLTAFMMMSFFAGLTGYTTALVAQYLGAERKKECGVVTTQAVILSLIAYPLILFCRPLGHLLFEKMGVMPAQMLPQKLYFDLLLYGVPLCLLRNTLSCFFSGIGRTKVVMAASCAAMLVNAGLNYILVFGKFGMPALGIRGAAYGTIAGSLCGLGVLLAAYTRKRNRVEFSLKRSLRFDFGITKKLLRYGTPAGLEFFLNILAFNGMVLTFHSHGLVTATAATIVLNWDLVSYVPLVGVEIGVMSLVGRSMGAGDPQTAHRSVISGMKLGLIYSAILFVFFVGFPENLVAMFRPAVASDVFTEAFPMAVFMVRVASVYVLVEVLFIVFAGALRGAGDTYWAMGMSVALHWLTVIALVIALRILGLSPQTGWVLVAVIFLLFSFLIYLRYHTGKWRTLRVVEREPVPVLTGGFHEPVDL